ncbi:hypothetical protein ACIPO9_17715 [Pseudomonas sp. NPDC090203]|uniref:hypothetical protein n=1 Tax=Pseudomonas sp. NPDC090203 TaxID=3364477 RepID=UPI00382FC3E9
MNNDIDLQGGPGATDPVPGTTDPLSPSRTDLNPSDAPGVDELPDNDGDTPKDSDDQAGHQEKMPDTEPDNAELDDQPNPR